jgi:hypothetical protein
MIDACGNPGAPDGDAAANSPHSEHEQPVNERFPAKFLTRS